ncbi:hypothetical protein HPB51_008857 [Rhipicephalus microplus]|uniref:CCHC-type domain-containing protein n=1 Tax=Rhipicephalus microplus TaxID=6941 RepID=A0A9J6ESH6_RHIMP|nr:hypothetical protein HPB51_008857 [Rhipicephalus microplus]
MLTVAPRGEPPERFSRAASGAKSTSLTLTSRRRSLDRTPPRSTADGERLWEHRSRREALIALSLHGPHDGYADQSRRRYTEPAQDASTKTPTTTCRGLQASNPLNLSKVSPKTLLLAVAHAAKIRSEKPDIKLRLDENQNVLTISTSSEQIAAALGQITKITVHATTYDITSYGIAPDNSCKGVVNGIGHEITPDDFLTEVEVPGYEVLTCRRLGNSGAMVLTFCGKRVPFFVNAYGQALRCYLYKRTIPHCRKCNKTGHCEDVCPQPSDTPKCRVCGDSLSPNNHECRPSCMLCGGNHPTTAKPCQKQFLPPVNRRKPPRSATPTKKAQSLSPSPGRQSSASESAARRRSHSRDKSGPKRGNSSSRSGFAGQPGSQGWHTDETTHHHGQQSGSHKKAQMVSWAGQFPPLPPSPHQFHSLTQTSTQERTSQPTPPRLPQPMSVDTQLHPDMPSTTARSDYCTREALNEMASSLRNEFAAMMQVEMQKMKDSIMAALTAPLQQLIQRPCNLLSSRL